MRYMIIVKASPESEAGVMPEAPLLAAMGAYHDELARAGVLLDANGLRRTAEGWRVQYDDEDRRRVIDGPFADSKEMIAGYTLIQVRTPEEALEWSKRYPNPRGPGQACAIEVRRVFEQEDFLAGPAIAQDEQAGGARA